MAGHFVRVRREKITACMTCPLCNNLLNNPTTISLCLHTFCRKCIYEKLSDDDVDSCPVCDINLGCAPVDKLRADHNLQDIRAKIFPFKRRKVEAPEVVPSSISPPTKRKERSLSSIVVSAPLVSMQTGLSGRRKRATIRKGGSTAKGSSPAIEESHKEDNDSADERRDRSISPEALPEIVQNRKQSSSAKIYSNRDPDGDSGDGDSGNNDETQEGKVDLWKPLNCLVEAANRTKSSRFSSQGAPHVKTEPSSAQEANIPSSKVKPEENGGVSEFRDDKNGGPSVPGHAKRKRIRSGNRNKGVEHGMRLQGKDGPIWFSLVASEDREGGAPLPQVPAAFIRVKDGSMPVLSIQKYLAKKLDLASEAEVQITCQGEPVLPELHLSTLWGLWLKTSSTHVPRRVRTSIGDSAHDFIMVLSYSRNIRPR